MHLWNAAIGRQQLGDGDAVDAHAVEAAALERYVSKIAVFEAGRAQVAVAEDDRLDVHPTVGPGLRVESAFSPLIGA